MITGHDDRCLRHVPERQRGPRIQQNGDSSLFRLIKAGVHRADREVPQLNASFREFAPPTRARPLVDFAKPRLIVQS